MLRAPFVVEGDDHEFAIEVQAGLDKSSRHADSRLNKRAATWLHV
jgi:hypothetical protein